MKTTDSNNTENMANPDKNSQNNVSDSQENLNFENTEQSEEQNFENQNPAQDNAEDTDNQSNEKDCLSEVDEKNLQIKALEEKYKDLNDKYLRLFSEFDNFRKRNLKEKIELTKTASAEIIEAILPVVDDLERAYQAAQDNPSIENIQEGLKLIQTKIKNTLKQKGLEEIPAVGEEFNTDFHEAITNTPAQKPEDKGKVIDQVQKGYTLNGKILRFAKVIVAN
ncbi:MAG: nucleotide exchange factor GrpE [Bacteroidota bacterium]